MTLKQGHEVRARIQGPGDPGTAHERASVRAGEGQAVTLTHAASERANAVRVLAQKALVSIRKQDMARAIERVAEQGFMGPTGVVLILTAERPREAAEPAKVSKVSRRGTVRATAEEVERAVQEAVDERNA